MAKSKIVGPDPLPKVGDAVHYNWPPENMTRPDLAGKSLPGKVTTVYDGFDGRLLDLDVDSGKGTVTMKSVPWQDADLESGNTWHWPTD
jgi:hypothetical protein